MRRPSPGQRRRPAKCTGGGYSFKAGMTPGARCGGGGLESGRIDDFHRPVKIGGLFHFRYQHGIKPKLVFDRHQQRHHLMATRRALSPGPEFGFYLPKSARAAGPRAPQRAVRPWWSAAAAWAGRPCCWPQALTPALASRWIDSVRGNTLLPRRCWAVVRGLARSWRQRTNFWPPSGTLAITRSVPSQRAAGGVAC